MTTMSGTMTMYDDDDRLNKANVGANLMTTTGAMAGTGDRTGDDDGTMTMTMSGDVRVTTQGDDDDDVCMCRAMGLVGGVMLGLRATDKPGSVSALWYGQAAMQSDAAAVDWVNDR